MSHFIDISNWKEQPWWNTGGTRNKKVYEHPDTHELYYFKESFRKVGRDYKYEFWSEIIASEIGKIIGIDVLKYEAAVRGQTIGCLSKSMFSEGEELIEGGKILQAFDDYFNPENKEDRNKYTFDLIIEALVYWKKDEFIPNLIQMLVFDALIGNSDRHQENWALISQHGVLTEGVASLVQTFKSIDLNENPNKWIRGTLSIIKRLYFKGENVRPEVNSLLISKTKASKFSPIYDSGCSFGRELSPEKIDTMLNDSAAKNRYVNRGKSEIHWQGVKVNHFELLKNIGLSEDHRDMVLNSVEQIIDKFDLSKFDRALKDVDKEVKVANADSALPENRKQLIRELVLLRLDRLKQLHDELK